MAHLRCTPGGADAGDTPHPSSQHREVRQTECSTNRAPLPLLPAGAGSCLMSACCWVRVTGDGILHPILLLPEPVHGPQPTDGPASVTDTSEHA